MALTEYAAREAQWQRERARAKDAAFGAAAVSFLSGVLLGVVAALGGGVGAAVFGVGFFALMSLVSWQTQRHLFD